MKLHRYLILYVTLVFLFITSNIAWSQALPLTKPEKVGLSSTRLERIDTALLTHIKEGKTAGAVVLVARKGKIAYFKSFGMQNTEAGLQMKTDTIFRIYSMSKPIVSVAAMILNEEGRLLLTDPVSKYIPELSKLQVAVEGTDPQTGEKTFTTVASQREITIQDLLRHTSGIVYTYLGAPSQLREMYKKAGIENRDQTLAEQMTKLSKLPLASQPGTRWEYGLSVDVLGRVIEIVSGMPLDRFIEERVLRPLNMGDTGFYVKAEKLNRLAEDLNTGKRMPMLDVTKPPTLLSGGGGMVGSTMDYARFCQMLLNGGQLDGTRVLGRKTVELMTSDHLGTIPGLVAGHGMGLGFGVRLQNGVVPRQGTAGEFYWIGLAGTHFWVDPKENLIGIIMVQDMVLGPTNYYRELIRPLVYQAIID